MRYYPVFIDLRRQPAVVVGGGVLAAEKAAGLAEAGATVTVVTASAGPEIEALAAAGSVRLVRREFRAGDLAGSRLAVDASGDVGVNRQTWKEAERLGVLINVVDRPARCRWIAPAVVRRDPLVIAVSTSGESPFLASAVRRRLERLYGEEWGPFVALVGRIRRRLRAQGSGLAEQTAVYRRLLRSGVRRLLREGGRSEAWLEAGRIAAEAGLARPGRVTLVGAGPGDPGLLTLAAAELLMEADVVIHDALIDPRTLALCRPDVTLVDVGKRGGRASPSQESITARMIGLAREGLDVVRLKGGDPFVFGRGGEELGALLAAGVDVAVVPGVTSAVAAPSAAGIPLTLRGTASSVAFITGQGGEGSWPRGLEAVAAAVDTLVVLMPVAALPRLVERLTTVLGPDRPAALVASATLPDQRVVRSRLATLVQDAAAAGIGTPATLVVGEVVEAVPTSLGLGGGRFADFDPDWLAAPATDLQPAAQA